jgi:hypothetical protein
MTLARRTFPNVELATLGAVLLFAACSPSNPSEDSSGGGGNSGAGGSSSGATTGGAPTGGTPSGGTPTGGVSAGGTPTGGSGGALGGGAGTGTGGSLGGTEGTTGGAAGVTGGAGASPGGSGGAATGGTAGGAGQATGGSGGKALDCSALPLCDTFESTAVGMPPSAALWTKIPTAASGTATVDSIGAHGSSRSLKVVSPDRLYLRNTSVIGMLGPVAYVRFYVRFETALAQGHAAFIVTHPMMVDQYSQSNELRLGGQDNVFHWNTDTDAANLPDVSPMGDAASFRPAAATWYCMELTINTNGHLNVSIDGMSQAGLTADGVATPNVDQAWVGSAVTLQRYTMLADFNFGWQSYGSGAMTLWFDDVALSSSPIGCP